MTYKPTQSKVIKNVTEGRKCPKGMWPWECPYNPKLGCDCGINPPFNKYNEKQV